MGLNNLMEHQRECCITPSECEQINPCHRSGKGKEIQQDEKNCGSGKQDEKGFFRTRKYCDGFFLFFIWSRKNRYSEQCRKDNDDNRIYTRDEEHRSDPGNEHVDPMFK